MGRGGVGRGTAPWSLAGVPRGYREGASVWCLFIAYAPPTTKNGFITLNTGKQHSYSRDGKETEDLTERDTHTGTQPTSEGGIHQRCQHPEGRISRVGTGKLHCHLDGRQLPLTEFKGNPSSRCVYRRHGVRDELGLVGRRKRSSVSLLTSPQKGDGTPLFPMGALLRGCRGTVFQCVVF